MNHAPRNLHRLIAPWLALPLAVTLATGIAYRTGWAWFGMGKETGGKVLEENPLRTGSGQFPRGAEPLILRPRKDDVKRGF